MPLRCLKLDGSSIHAFDVSSHEWSLMKARNKHSQHLTMPCCDAEVVLKKSKLGTQFFAHKKRGDCTTAPEMEEHLILKKEAVLAARRCGWTAQTEVAGVAPNGAKWRADVLAIKGKHKVAIEIQWSRQTDEVTLQRQKRYAESGVRCLWLMRQPKFPISIELPAVCIGGEKTMGFLAMLPKNGEMKLSDREKHDRWYMVSKISDFLDAALSHRLKYLSFLDADVGVKINAWKLNCPHCGKLNAQICPVELTLKFPHADALIKERFRLSQISVTQEIENIFVEKIPMKTAFAEIKIVQGFLDNGLPCLRNKCVKCDRNIDYEVVIRSGKERLKKFEIAHFDIKADTNWAKLFAGRWSDKWHVMSSAGLQGT